MSRKGKHLTLDQRMEIQYGLKRQLKLVEIAGIIGKDPRTVSFEIKRNLIKIDSDCFFMSDRPRQRVRGTRGIRLSVTDARRNGVA